MILKKDKISNGKIFCYLTVKKQMATIKTNQKTFELDLSSNKEVESLDEYDIAFNYILRINKFLSFLKSEGETYNDSKIEIFVDNELLVNIIKPEGYITTKPSKAFKKSTTNQRLKAILGITLQNLSEFPNIDLAYANFLSEEGDTMNNKILKNLNQDNTNFNLDIPSSSDIIDLPDMDSLNYNENDLFKEFDLNTDNLFKEKENEDFIFDENIFNTSDDAQKPITDTQENEFIFAPSKDIKIDEPIFNTNEVSKEDELVFAPSEDFSIDESIFNTNEVSKEDELVFTPSEDFSIDEPVFTTNDVTIENEPVFATDEIVIKEEPIFTTDEVVVEDEPVFTPHEVVVEDEPVFTPHEVIVEDEPVFATDEIVIKEEPVFIPHEDTKNDEPVSVIKSPNPDVTDNVETSSSNTVSENIVDSKVINGNRTEKQAKSSRINNHSPAKEVIDMNKIFKDNTKTIDIKNEFIQNELIELKNILENKAKSYQGKFSELNSVYEEKHAALKDLTLTDEAEQLKIFKEFLSCKSSMISLKALNDTCSNIISDIEKLFN